MSGPLEVGEIEVLGEASNIAAGPTLVMNDSRIADVGTFQVRRALPTRGRRTVGSWCFVDHAGPLDVTETQRPDIGPHPHMGLQTVTWLLGGELVHRDSLGTEQPIRPEQLNLMTAGHGVAHAEETVPRYRGDFHAVQLWVAQPSSTRDGSPAFEHHGELTQVDLTNGIATVLIGELAGTTSPARRDTEHMGADLALRRGAVTVPLRPEFEYAMVAMMGAASIGAETLTPGHLLYLGTGRDELELSALEPSRLLLLGGVPFDEQILMWWNFVARTREEIENGYRDWSTDSGRFGHVASSLPRIEAARPLWRQHPK